MSIPSSTSAPEAPGPREVRMQAPTRRRFLQLAGFGALGVVGALALPRVIGLRVASNAGDGDVTRSDSDIVLVSIQLGGGMDFLNTVVPLDDSRYPALRGDGTRRLGDDSEGAPTLHRLDSSFALNSMSYMADRFAVGELAIVHGVGWEGSSLSHFEATDMWEKGSPDLGTTSGWLGRALADVVRGPVVDPLLAISLGGVSPSMYADGWSPVGLRAESRVPWSAAFTEEYRSLDRGLADVPVAPGSDLWSRARNSQLELRGIGARLGPIMGGRDGESGEDVGKDDAGYLGRQLDLIADLVNGGIPTRAFHVPHDGFDTHNNQRSVLAELNRELDTAIRRFQQRLGPNAERVVIATWSEFGRRPGWNGEGTEHGTAGVQFVVGPRVKGGHVGEPPPLDRFDEDDNFIVTTDFRDYLAGLALGTLGADPGRVVDGGRGPLDLVEA